MKEQAAAQTAACVMPCKFYGYCCEDACMSRSTSELYLHEFERQDKPRPGDEGYVEESETVAEQPGSQHFDMPHLVDQFEAEHVCRHLTQVIQHGRDAK